MSPQGVEVLIVGFSVAAGYFLYSCLVSRMQLFLRLSGLLDGKRRWRRSPLDKVTCGRGEMKLRFFHFLTYLEPCSQRLVACSYEQGTSASSGDRTGGGPTILDQPA